MSISVFNEVKHPRGDGGRFAEKRLGEPDDLTAPVGEPADVTEAWDRYLHCPASELPDALVGLIRAQVRSVHPNADSFTVRVNEHGRSGLADLRDRDGGVLVDFADERVATGYRHDPDVTATEMCTDLDWETWRNWSDRCGCRSASESPDVLDRSVDITFQVVA